MKFNTKVIHGGQIKEKGYGAVMPPIYQTSTYAQTKPGEHQGYEYSRTHNPTRTSLENSIASIENGKHGLAFSSGLAAIDAVLNSEKHNYYFFAADPSNPGYHSFARTLSEHKRNARKFHKYLNSKGIKK